MRSMNNTGVAMFVALMTLVIASGIALLMFTRTINEMQHSRDDAAIVQTLLLARGGANVGAALLGTEVNVLLRDAVRQVARSGAWTFGTDAGGRPGASSVVTDLNQVVSLLQPRVDALVCNEVVTPDNGEGEIRITIFFASTACGGSSSLPDNVGLPTSRYISGPARGAAGIGVQEYAMPYVLVAEAELGPYRRNIVMQGEYRFDVGQASFALYAYFTESEFNSVINSRLWFTDQSLIDGPTHTNGNFSFAGKPWFGGRVTSAGQTSGTGAHFNTSRCISWNWWGNCTATSDFYSPSQMGGNPSAPVIGAHQPNFSDGVDWDAVEVPMPVNHFQQRDVALGVGRVDEGLIVGTAGGSGSIYRVEMWAGSETSFSLNTTAANLPTLVGGVWTPRSEYQYIRQCPTSDNNTCTLVRINEFGVLQTLNSADGTWVTRPTRFNGVIFAEQVVERFGGPVRSDAADLEGISAPPALAWFSEITLASNSNVRITRDVKYEDAPCTSSPVKIDATTVEPANCPNLAARNVMGIYTQDGNILVGHGNNNDRNAPRNVNVHSVLMSARGQVRVDNYNNGSYMGEFRLLGGMIQNTRGAFGQFQTNWDGSTTNTSGRARVYTYDRRMSQGTAPPFFPATNIDDVTSVRFFNFGQREQLY